MSIPPERPLPTEAHKIRQEVVENATAALYAVATDRPGCDAFVLLCDVAGEIRRWAWLPTDPLRHRLERELDYILELQRASHDLISGPEGRREFNVRFYRDENDEWRWMATAANGKRVGAATEGYKNHSDALQNWQTLAHGIGVVDVTEMQDAGVIPQSPEAGRGDVT